ncbi:MAG TPA: class I SAM-dependent methyltransferase [Alphaproteobacteria bacterium]
MHHHVDFKSYDHYIGEHNEAKPKVMVQKLLDMMHEDGVENAGACIDLGCASGEMLHFIRRDFPQMELAGIDLFDEFIQEAKARHPDIDFRTESALDLPTDMSGKYDVTTAFGLMSLFDETEISTFWDNVLRITKPGGLIYVLSPVNEYGVDMMIRHRKRIQKKLTDWESAWNIHSQETIRELLASKGQEVEFRPFQITMQLEPKEDPLRTWTMKTEKNDLQLTNGMKLLVNHYYMVVRKA